MNTPLIKALTAQSRTGRHRFHVPFHAGHPLDPGQEQLAANLFTWDLTELPPLDVLGQPNGVLKESQNLVAHLFGAAHSFYLINGASVGIMAALLASGLQPGRHVLVARNCHRSVIHGLILAGASPHWILPQVLPRWGLWGQVEPSRLDETLSVHPEIDTFVMTHPTYEGIASDMKAIVQVCRTHGVKLIVDEAHGSLFPLLENLPCSALTAGADAVIHSLHKSGGSLTQTALLHLAEGSCLNPGEVQQALNVLQTTSPSYPLLASLEAACATLAQPEFLERITATLQAIEGFRRWVCDTLSTIDILSDGVNPGSFQVYLRSRKLPGESFARILEDTHGIAFEAATSHGVLLVMNLGLPPKAFDDLKSALLAIDAQTAPAPDARFPQVAFDLPDMALTPREAFLAQGCPVPKAQAVGRVSRQVVASCPPGIPVLIPGEVVRVGHLPYLPETLLVVGHAPHNAAEVPACEGSTVHTG